MMKPKKEIERQKRMKQGKPKLTEYQRDLKKGLEAVGFTDVNVEWGVSATFKGQRYSGRGLCTAEKAGDLFVQIAKKMG